MNDPMNNSEKSVQCSFCNNEYPSLAIGEHLMLCGNKTDQCPKCEKYIRRAIFAYHYENNCVNLDETEDHPSGITKMTNASPTVVSSHASQSAMSFNVRKENDFPRTSEPQAVSSSQSVSIPVITECLFCQQQCEVSERTIHQERCLRNPINVRPNPSPRSDSASNHYSGASANNQLNDIDKIPCEVCDQPIDWIHYIKHLEACVRQEEERIQNQLNQANQMNPARCQHCHKDWNVWYLKLHQATCFSNPRFAALEARFQNTFSLPSLSPGPYLFCPFGFHGY